jgi:dsRNA-specific ribonuclease
LRAPPKIFSEEIRLQIKWHYKMHPQQQEAVEKIIDYHFTDSQLLEEALQAAGRGNQRLALLGDAIISLAVLDAWYPTGASASKD